MRLYAQLECEDLAIHRVAIYTEGVRIRRICGYRDRGCVRL